MGVEKEGSKYGGGYVGGFLQLFDWKVKSRRKLFTNKSNFPEHSKQGKRSDGNFPVTRIHLLDEDEIGPGPCVKDDSDYSCASSVTDTEGYGAKDPGVVARLMGLDFLPTSNSSDLFSSPFFDSRSLCGNPNHSINFDYHLESKFTCGGDLPCKVDRPVTGPSELKLKKIPSRPLEKFQTETLPPKSAKTIPITHHKLLSPIKNPNFISSNNAAHIMETAAKIINSKPRGTTAKAKMPMVGSSLVPLKVWDLKEKAEAGRKARPVGFTAVRLKVQDTREKVEAAHKPSRLANSSCRPVESNAAKILKGQSMNKSWDGSLDTSSFRVVPDMAEGSSSASNKERSVSLALQAKVNIQRREGLDRSSSRRCVLNSQTNVRRNFHKKSSTHKVVGRGVLRQNNQKQNAQIVKEKLASKPPVPDSRGRKLQADNHSSGQQKNSNKFAGNSKIVPRKLHTEVTPSHDEYPYPYSSTKNIPGKKRSLDRNCNSEKNLVVDHAILDKDRKSNQSNSLKDSRERCMDVVSFTFTSPLGRSMHVSETSSPVAQNGLTDAWGKRVLIDSDSTNVEDNVIGGDALSLLLEQKLRELTFVVESSSLDSVKAGIASIAPGLQDLTPCGSLGSTIPGYHETNDQPKHNSAFSTTGPSVLVPKDKFQELDDMGEPSSIVNDTEARKLFHCRHPSPISILEPSFSTESCNSSDTMIDGNSIGGSNLCSSIQAQEIIDSSYQSRFLALEAADVELSDSATSTSTGFTVSNHDTMPTMTNLTRSTEWQLEYVKDMIYKNVDRMFNNYALGFSDEIINPQLFYQLESPIGELENDVGKCIIRRRLLFDCVNECLDLRCRQYVSAGFRTWSKRVATLTWKEQLAEEVYKEITGWSSMGDCMVDELVDRDMSSQYGRWLDFEADGLSLGAEIEGQIFSSLLHEILASCA